MGVGQGQVNLTNQLTTGIIRAQTGPGTLYITSDEIIAHRGCGPGLDGGRASGENSWE